MDNPEKGGDLRPIPIADEEFKKLFESAAKPNDRELTNMSNLIKKDIAALNASGVTPTYYYPKNDVLNLLEKIILSGAAESAQYSFTENKNTIRKDTDVIFFYGVENKIIPMRETEDAINELKNPKPKEQPEKKSLFSRVLKL